MARAAAKHDEQAFVVPDPASVSDQVCAALAEKAHLEQQCKDLRQREQHLAKELSDATNGRVKLGNSAREEARALERLRQQLNEVRHEAVIVERARDESRRAFDTANNKASRLVCEKIAPEWNQRLRDCAIPLFQFVNAHVALMQLKQQLQDREVRYMSFLPAATAQFNRVIDSITRDELLELINAGAIERDEIPAVIRDRYDI